MTHRLNIDPTHSRIGFSVKHLGVSTVRGQFGQYQGSLEVDLDDPAGARGEGAIEVASITTGNEQRDAHLRSADFFEAERYPQIKFVLTRLEKQDEDTYLVHGDMTIKETTRPVTLEAVLEGRADDPWGQGDRFAVSASGQIGRRDFGLTWDGMAGAVPIVSDRIKLEIDLALVGAPIEVPASA